MAPSWLLGILSPHFLPRGWAPGMLMFLHHWKLTWPPSALLSPQEILGLKRVRPGVPVSEKSAGPFPPQWPCCARGFSSWRAQSCPSPLLPLAWLLLQVKAYRSLTTLCPQVPFPTMVALLCMWFGISLPLVYLGYYFGFRKQPYDNPVRTNQIPRQIPEQRWYMNRFVG